MIRDVVTIFGVIAGLSYYVTNIRNQKKARQLQALSNVFSRGPTNFKFLEMELHDYEEFRLKHFVENDQDSVSFRQWWDIQEELGVYVKEGLLDVRPIYLYMSGTITKAWEKNVDFIVEHRKRSDWPRYLIESEYLYNKIIEYAEEHPELKS